MKYPAAEYFAGGRMAIARSRLIAAMVTNSASIESIRGWRAASRKKWQSSSAAADHKPVRLPSVAPLQANTAAQVIAAAMSEGRRNASSFHPSALTHSAASHQ